MKQSSNIKKILYLPTLQSIKLLLFILSLFLVVSLKANSHYDKWLPPVCANENLLHSSSSLYLISPLGLDSVLNISLSKEFRTSPSGQNFFKRLAKPFVMVADKFKKSQLKEKLFLVLAIVLTGPIGGHRLILGTKSYVPIVYAVTLGGGLGLLPVLDLISILITKDLAEYKNSSKIIMWAD